MNKKAESTEVSAKEEKKKEVKNVQFVTNISFSQHLESMVEPGSTRFRDWSVNEAGDFIFVTTNTNRRFKVPMSAVLRIEYK